MSEITLQPGFPGQDDAEGVAEEPTFLQQWFGPALLELCSCIKEYICTFFMVYRVVFWMVWLIGSAITLIYATFVVPCVDGRVKLLSPKEHNPFARADLVMFNSTVAWQRRWVDNGFWLLSFGGITAYPVCFLAYVLNYISFIGAVIVHSFGNISEVFACMLAVHALATLASVFCMKAQCTYRAGTFIRNRKAGIVAFFASMVIAKSLTMQALSCRRSVSVFWIIVVSAIADFLLWYADFSLTWEEERKRQVTLVEAQKSMPSEEDVREEDVQPKKNTLFTFQGNTTLKRCVLEPIKPAVDAFGIASGIATGGVLTDVWDGRAKHMQMNAQVAKEIERQQKPSQPPCVIRLKHALHLFAGSYTLKGNVFDKLDARMRGKILAGISQRHVLNVLQDNTASFGEMHRLIKMEANTCEVWYDYPPLMVPVVHEAVEYFELNVVSRQYTEIYLRLWMLFIPRDIITEKDVYEAVGTVYTIEKGQKSTLPEELDERTDLSVTFKRQRLN